MFPFDGSVSGAPLPSTAPAGGSSPVSQVLSECSDRVLRLPTVLPGSLPFVRRPLPRTAVHYTGGPRKLRWAESARGKGKRGGVRVIYYWYAPQELIYLLLLYSKGERDDLTASEKKALRQLVTREFK